MKKSMFRIAVFSLMVAAIAVTSGQVFGQEDKGQGEKAKAEKPQSGEKATKKQGAYPFHGKVAAVDKTAKTIKVGERTFQVTSETRIRKAGKPATLNDVAVGEEIGGNWRKTEDGKVVAMMVRVGPKSEATEAGKDPVKKEGGVTTEKAKKGDKAKKETNDATAQ